MLLQMTQLFVFFIFFGEDYDECSNLEKMLLNRFTFVFEVILINFISVYYDVRNIKIFGILKYCTDLHQQDLLIKFAVQSSGRIRSGTRPVLQRSSLLSARRPKLVSARAASRRKSKKLSCSDKLLLLSYVGRKY